MLSVSSPLKKQNLPHLHKPLECFTVKYCLSYEEMNITQLIKGHREIHMKHSAQYLFLTLGQIERMLKYYKTYIYMCQISSKAGGEKNLSQNNVFY